MASNLSNRPDLVLSEVVHWNYSNVYRQWSEKYVDELLHDPYAGPAFGILCLQVAKKYNLDLKVLVDDVERNKGYEVHDAGYWRAVIQSANEMRKWNSRKILIMTGINDALLGDWPTVVPEESETISVTMNFDGELFESSATLSELNEVMDKRLAR